MTDTTNKESDVPRVRRRSRRILSGRRVRIVTIMAFDAVRIIAAYTAVLLLRFDGAVPVAHWRRFELFLPAVVAIHLAANAGWRLHEQLWRHAGIAEVSRLIKASAAAMLLVLTVDLLLPRRVPLSVAVLGPMLAAALVGGSRLLARLSSARIEGRSGPSVVVIGTSDEAAALVRALQTSTRRGAPRPIAVLTSDAKVHGLSLLGVPVRGDLDQLAAIAVDRSVAYALLAGTDRTMLRRAADVTDAVGIPLKLVPSVDEILAGSGSTFSVASRDLAIEDILGREEVTISLDDVRRVVGGRRVLVTGAGGSIGGEIARQVAALEPAELVLLDHDETHLFEVAIDLGGDVVQLLADICDRGAIHRAFEQHRPEVVFHAAAHKHVPLIELHPTEAARTNVVGTRNVLASAAAVRTEHLVFISTDKAVDPTSVMGASKWLGEQLVSTMAPPGSRWCAVRFGNVAGSRGSVIPTFRRQLEAGGPITVTDQKMMRFFMSIDEAVRLVLQATALAHGGDTFVLEMGEPVNILDLARRIIRLSGLDESDIEITITGARPGEKVVEVLHHDAETLIPTTHPAVNRLLGPKVDETDVDLAVSHLERLAAAGNGARVREVLLDVHQRAYDAMSESTPWTPAAT